MKKLIVLAHIIIFFIGCPSAPKNSARIYIEQQDYERAKEQIYIGLRDNPNDYELYVLLAKAEIGLRRWSEVSKAFQDGIAIDSIKTINWLLGDTKNISAYRQAFYNAALADRADKKHEQALINLGYAKILDPKDVSTYILEGGLYSELGDSKMANQAYAQALSIDPENPDAYFLVGKEYFDKIMYDSSVVKFEKAIEYFKIRHERDGKILFQNLPEVDKELARKMNSLWFTKKNDELDELIKVKLGIDAGLTAMRSRVEKFYKTSEGLARSYYWLGIAYYNLKDESVAFETLQKSLEILPDDLDALFYAGEILIKMKKYDDALNYLRRITQLKEDDTYAWFYTAVCHSQLKDFNKAVDIYENKVLALDPENIDALTNLAYCYRELGNNKKALEYLMKVEELQKEQE
jgi:tetratricopeptide (TPR) repeat protein